MPCQVRVMTWGQVPLVMVLTMVSMTPLEGVPCGGTQALVQVGGLKLHWVPHSTVLFDAQFKVKTHEASGVTTKFTLHTCCRPWESVKVTVIG